MIRLYKSTEFFDRSNLLNNNDAFFDSTVKTSAFDSEFANVMYSIDKAKILDKNTGAVQTPYGVCGRDCLSSGCKTVLNLLYIIKTNKFSNIKAINATECGWNALEELFKHLEKYKYNIGIVLEHEDEIYNCSKRDYLVNGKRHITDLIEYDPLQEED